MTSPASAPSRGSQYHPQRPPHDLCAVQPCRRRGTADCRLHIRALRWSAEGGWCPICDVAGYLHDRNRHRRGGWLELGLWHYAKAQLPSSNRNMFQRLVHPDLLQGSRLSLVRARSYCLWAYRTASAVQVAGSRGPLTAKLTQPHDSAIGPQLAHSGLSSLSHRLMLTPSVTRSHLSSPTHWCGLVDAVGAGPVANECPKVHLANSQKDSKPTRLCPQ